ncbi:MAG: hypothetical protein M1833_005880 [Piccolia ochrophora]|nr:MAG: hypothetical protein M1833_005880 [Piccolia ochrophora]
MMNLNTVIENGFSSRVARSTYLLTPASPFVKETPIASAAPSASRESYLPQLHQLETPVPDLAATLTTPAEEENVDFLRAHSPILQEADSTIARRIRSAARSSAETVRFTRQRRQARELAAYERGRDVLNRETGGADARPYGDRIPLRQSLYDWAPMGGEETLFDWSSPPDDDAYAPWQTLARGPQASGAGLASTTTRPVSSSNRTPGTNATSQSSDLRNTALAQAMRRHPRMSQRPRNELETYMLDPGRQPRRQGEEDRDMLRQTRLLRPPSMINSGDRRQRIPTSELRASVDAYRQRYLHNPSPGAEGPLERAVKYLERVRSSYSKEESVSVALNSGIIQHLSGQSLLGKDRDDFLLDTSSIPPPSESSWLCVGAVFQGTQHASGGPNTITRRLSPHNSTGSSQSIHLDDFPTMARPIDAQFPVAHDADTLAREDKWPVKVTIQSIDYNTMQLSGEMEAFDVPDRTAPNGKSSITTYLEGEIIDLNTHTLETKSFRASPRIDGTYWRKLMPFRECEEADIMHNLLSKRWLTEHVSEEWILMRWKERCFITPSDQRLGLTISGFYYVSLRRSDGFVEGLYYDPASAPYQHLVLQPVKRMFPTYEFR